VENELLNIEYRTACLAIKAINSSVSMNEAADKLGVHVNKVYDILRRNRIKMKRGSCRIMPQKVTFRDANDVLYQADPI